MHRILIVGRTAYTITDENADRLETLYDPMADPDAHGAEAERIVLEALPRVEMVVIGGGIPEELRARWRAFVERHCELPVAMKDRASGLGGLPDFVRAAAAEHLG